MSSKSTVPLLLITSLVIAAGVYLYTILPVTSPPPAHEEPLPTIVSTSTGAQPEDSISSPSAAAPSVAPLPVDPNSLGSPDGSGSLLVPATQQNADEPLPAIKSVNPPVPVDPAPGGSTIENSQPKANQVPSSAPLPVDPSNGGEQSIESNTGTFDVPPPIAPMD